MKNSSAKFYTLLFLVVMFAAPGIAAYVFYQHPGWLGATKINKGTLLNPPVALKALDNKAKWRIVFWEPDACDAACLKQLDTLARVRLALGRKLYQVDQWIMFGDKAPDLSSETQSILKELDFQVTRLPEADARAQHELFAKPNVFLVDPNNYVILSYSASVNPDDVYKDLKLLLNTTEKNG